MLNQDWKVKQETTMHHRIRTNVCRVYQAVLEDRTAIIRILMPMHAYVDVNEARRREGLLAPFADMR